MKIATYKDGSRDGQLVVVSRDLTMAHYATGIASRLQQALDDWNFLSPQLQELSQTLNHGKARHGFAFDPRSCMAPLPRAFFFASCAPEREPAPPAGAAVGVRRSDALRGPCDAAPATNEASASGSAPAWRAGAELVVITGDLGPDVASDDSLAAVRLVTACVVWQHSGDAAGVHPRPTASFCPVAVTTDELGDAWHQTVQQLQLQLFVNGRRVPADNAQQPPTLDLGHSLARCANGLGVRAGSLIGTGVQVSAVWSANGGASLRMTAGGPDGEGLFGAISASAEAAR